MRGKAAGLGTSGAVIPFASSLTRQMPILRMAIYAAIPASCGSAAGAKLLLASLIPAIAGLLLPGLVARWMLRLPGR